MSCDSDVNTNSSSAEIAKQQRFLAGRVVRVGLCEGVRSDLQLMTAEAPTDAPAERALELRERPHGNRVGVLRVEPRVSEQLRTWSASERVCRVVHRSVFRGVECHVHLVGARVVVDDLDAIAAWTGAQLLIGHVDRRGDDILAAIAQGRILRKDREPACRSRDFGG